MECGARLGRVSVRALYQGKNLTMTQGTYTLLPRGILTWAKCYIVAPSRGDECMTKTELVNHVAATVQLPRQQTEAVIMQCLQTIMEAVRAGESVELRGFGRFQCRHRQARQGRNPRTGDMVQIPAKAVPTFSAGKTFQEMVHTSAASSGRADAVAAHRQTVSW